MWQEAFNAKLKNATPVRAPWGTVTVYRMVGKEQSYKVNDADPVTQLVARSHGALAYETAGDLLDEHDGNVDEAYAAWSLRESQLHTHGDCSTEAVTGSSYRIVRLEQTSGRKGRVWRLQRNLSTNTVFLI